MCFYMGAGVGESGVSCLTKRDFIYEIHDKWSIDTGLERNQASFHKPTAKRLEKF